MKYFSLFCLVLLFGLQACVKTEFDAPPVSESCTKSATISIADLKASHSLGQEELIAAGTVITGVVAADDASGNFYRNIILQDETAGIEIRFNVTDLYNEFPVGRRLTITCDSLILSDYNGVTQVGEIQEAMISTRICKGEQGLVVEPITVTMDQLDASYISRLIKLEGVEFAGGSAGVNYADAVNLYSVNHVLEECGTENEMLVRSSGFATFASAKTPVGSGSIVAIYSVFGSDQQLYIRDLNDVDMEMDRCDGTGGTGLTSLNEDFQSGADNEDIALEGWSNIAVKGTRLWRGKEFSGNIYAQATAYNDTSPEMETWLITPALDLSVEKTLNFQSALAFWTHDGLSVWISTDFTGFNFASATWTELNCTVAGQSDANYDYVDSGLIDLSAYSGTAYIGFKHIGNPTDGTTSYIIDDVVVEDK
ncbi:MAG: choice-of-anchor J domain-containing protein [Saprospiraceae bacterium]|nr:choice-of-anchor J domain-containing protein [Saprospiraceae bacterium]